MADVLRDKKIREKLTEGMNYYEELKEGAKIEKGKLDPKCKWNDEKEVSETLKNFISSLTEDLNIEQVKTFEIVDAYFHKNQRLFDKIESCESTIKECKDKFPGKAGYYQTELETFLQQNKGEIIRFYFEERRFLLKSIILIFLYHTTSRIPDNAANEIVKHLMEKN